MTDLTLIGFCHSVYTRVVQMALAEKGLVYAYREVNPFSEEGAETLDGSHPFGRVPVLEHRAFRVYETTAILSYLDDAGLGPTLRPLQVEAAARAAQVVAIVDSYGYWPMVRHVFGHGVYRPLLGLASDPKLVADGLDASRAVLHALEMIAEEGLVLTGDQVTVADCHLAPMMDYFTMQEGGAAMLKTCPSLSKWFAAISARDSFMVTQPDLGRIIE